MRRSISLLALVLASALLAACGKGGLAASTHGRSATTSASATSSTSSTSSSPAPPGGAGGEGSSAGAPTKAQALAFARAVNLTAADVPGFAANRKHDKGSAGEKQLERKMLRCAGLSRAAVGVAEEASKNFVLKHAILDFGVSSEVGVEASTAAASKALDALRSAHVRSCFTSYLDQTFQGKEFGGAKVSSVKIQSGTPPAPGAGGSFGWRVTATFMLRGIKVPVYLDFLGFVDGPAQVTLLSSGLLRPFPAAVQQHLFSLLLSRAKAHQL